jgi:hypothetical protein
MVALAKGWKPADAPKRKRRKPVDYEGQEQTALMNWMRVQYPAAFESTFHVPNGGSRNLLEAKKLKAQGVKAGVPDVYVELARGGFFGLRIEMKATPPHDAEVSPSQREWVARLNGHGYYAVVCRGIDEAMRIIRWYLALPPTEVVRG